MEESGEPDKAKSRSDSANLIILWDRVLPEGSLELDVLWWEEDRGFEWCAIRCRLRALVCSASAASNEQGKETKKMKVLGNQSD